MKAPTDQAREWISFPVRLDPEDTALLEELRRVEKLDKATIVRRALRAYGRLLNVEVAPEQDAPIESRAEGPPESKVA